MSLKLFTTPLLSVALAISYSIFGGIDNYSNIPGSQVDLFNLFYQKKENNLN